MGRWLALIESVVMIRIGAVADYEQGAEDGWEILSNTTDLHLLLDY